MGVKSLKDNEWAGNDKRPSELIKYLEESLVYILTAIYNKIRQTGE